VRPRAAVPQSISVFNNISNRVTNTNIVERGPMPRPRLGERESALIKGRCIVIFWCEPWLATVDFEFATRKRRRGVPAVLLVGFCCQKSYGLMLDALSEKEKKNGSNIYIPYVVHLVT
jgi:hypothetical protein